MYIYHVYAIYLVLTINMPVGQYPFIILTKKLVWKTTKYWKWMHCMTLSCQPWLFYLFRMLTKQTSWRQCAMITNLHPHWTILRWDMYFQILGTDISKFHQYIRIYVSVFLQLDGAWYGVYHLIPSHLEAAAQIHTHKCVQVNYTVLADGKIMSKFSMIVE